jgi:zinc transport system substrate-binding protein
MLWEGDPIKESVEKLKEFGVNSLVFSQCSNIPAKGDFMSVMQQNIETLKVALLEIY